MLTHLTNRNGECDSGEGRKTNRREGVSGETGEPGSQFTWNEDEPRFQDRGIKEDKKKPSKMVGFHRTWVKDEDAVAEGKRRPKIRSIGISRHFKLKPGSRDKESGFRTTKPKGQRGLRRREE